jgi:ABC-type glycerol-3-phosphate transport system permease component
MLLPRMSDWLSPWSITLTTVAGGLVLALLLIAAATFSRPDSWRRRRTGTLRTLRVTLAALAVAGLGAAARSPGRHAAFIVGISVGAVVLLMMGLGELMPTHALQVRRRRLILLIRVALGTIVAAMLLVAAHCNGYDRWYENYATALLVARMGEYAVNSLLITTGAVVTTICIASLAAFALTKLDFLGSDAFLYTFIAGFAIPGQLILVPLFLMMRHWTIPDLGFSFMDSRFGLILIYAATGLPFSIFLLTGFFASLPSELGEAAAIDGCGEFATFRKVYFPLAMPGLTTAAIFNFLGVWNEYNFALVFITNPKLKTLPVGLYVLNVSQQYAANWPALFSGIVILWAPTFLLFLVLQKQIIAGLTLGSVKG